jgi:hypothetical protein
LLTRPNRVHETVSLTLAHPSFQQNLIVELFPVDRFIGSALNSVGTQPPIINPTVHAINSLMAEYLIPIFFITRCRLRRAKALFSKKPF